MVAVNSAIVDEPALKIIFIINIHVGIIIISIFSIYGISPISISNIGILYLQFLSWWVVIGGIYFVVVTVSLSEFLLVGFLLRVVMLVPLLSVASLSSEIC